MSTRYDTANPFPGLRPFQRGEEHLFFGRERQVDAMVDTLAAHRFLAVVGTSGCGKSSLVNCGLLPALHLGLLADAGSSWRVVHCRPGADPLGALAAALAAPGVLYPEAERSVPLVEIVDTRLRMSRRGLVDTYVQARLAPDQNMLVVVDQFEELFRYRDVVERRDAGTSDPETRAFVKLLLEALRAPQHPIHVVITMRSDFLGDCARFAGLPEAINQGQFLVPRMTRNERRQAIAGPVKVAGAQLDPVLETRLVNDVGDDPDQLSILQHALRQTWRRWAEGRDDALGLAHYQAVGAMSAALDQHAERAYAGLADDGQRALCERIFRALTDTGTDARGIRRPTPLDELCAIVGTHPALVKPILEVFRAREQAFLMPPATDPLDDDAVIDISHESLMRNWRRLRRWSESEAESATIYRRLVDSAALHANGRASLYREGELAFVSNWLNDQRPTEAWAAQYGGGLPRVLRFIELSDARAEKEARAAASQKRVRILSASLVVLLLLAWAYGTASQKEVERRKAVEKQEHAEALETKAKKEKRRAVSAEARALEAEKDAVRNAERATEEAGIGWAMGSSAHDPTMAALSLLAAQIDTGRSWKRTYRKLLQRPLAEVVFNVPGPVLHGAWHPRGDAFATYAAGSLEIHGNGARRWSVDRVEALQWSPDGRWLMTVEGQRVRLRNEGTLRTWGDEVLDAAFLADGRLALVGKTATCALCLEIVRIGEEGTLTRESQQPASGFRKGSLRAVGDQVVGVFTRSVCEDCNEEVRLYSAAQNTLSAPARFALSVNANRHSIKAVDVTADGGAMAFAAGTRVFLWSALVPGAIEVVRPPGPRPRGAKWTPLSAEAWVYAIAWSPDGRRLVAATDTGIIVWNREGEQVGQERTRESVRHVAWSPLDPSFGRSGRVQQKNPESLRLLTMTRGGDLELRYRDGTPIATMRHPGDALRGVGDPEEVPSGAAFFDPEGTRVLSIGSDHSARVWKLDTLPLRLWHPHGVGQVAWRPDGRALLVNAANGVESDRRIRFWPMEGEATPTTIGAGKAHHWDVAWSASGERLALGAGKGRGSTVQIWKPPEGRKGRWKRGTSRRRGDKVHDLAWSPDGCLLAAGSNDGSVLVLDREGRIVHEAEEPGWWIRHVEWRPFAAQRVCPTRAAPRTYELVSSSSGKQARLFRGEWPGGDWSRVRTVEFRRWAQASAWRPGAGDMVVTASGGRSRAWDPASGDVIAHLELVKTNRFPRWSPDGHHLALVASNVVGFWSVDAVRGEQPAKMTPHSGEPRISWRHDSRYAAAGSVDRVLRIWNRAGEVVMELETEHGINDAEWSPVGSRLALANAAGEAVVLPITQAAIEAPMAYLTDRVRGCLPARYRVEFLHQSEEEARKACMKPVEWPTRAAQ